MHGGGGECLGQYLNGKAAFGSVETSVQTGGLGMGESLLLIPPFSHVQDDTRFHNGKLSHTIKGSWFPMYFAKYLLRESPYAFCKVFATWISVCILQSVCFMILPMDFAKCLLHDSPNGFCKVFATWFSQCILAKCLLHESPNVFCKVLATWFSQCILQSICYMILPMCFCKVFATWFPM
jgi:hypothetical protein